MKEQHKRFADYYIELDNGTQAAIKAGYSKKTAGAIASRLLKDVNIKEYIKERLASKESDRVASQNEVLEFLTQVMRGEVKDQLGLETTVRDRKGAAELLGKRYGLFVEKVEHSGNAGVTILYDIPRTNCKNE